jgi:hypothetical protein
MPFPEARQEVGREVDFLVSSQWLLSDIREYTLGFQMVLRITGRVFFGGSQKHVYGVVL